MYTDPKTIAFDAGYSNCKNPYPDREICTLYYNMGKEYKCTEKKTI